MSTPSIPVINRFIDADQATRDVTMQESNLSEEFVNQPGLFYHYSAKFAQAERQHSDVKLRLELVEAQAAVTIRDAAIKDGEKLSENGVKERVRLNPTVIKTEMALNEAKEVETSLKGLVEALRHKKDMLIIRGNVSRDEFKANLSLMQPGHAANDGSLRDRARAAAG